MTVQDTSPVQFADRIFIEQVEEGRDLAPKFDDRGLVPVVNTDLESDD